MEDLDYMREEGTLMLRNYVFRNKTSVSTSAFFFDA